MTIENAKQHDAIALASWYQAEHRQLPWRTTKDPYAIWISETMLQQTRVETVIPYYHAFMERYPTVQHLAAADFEEVAKLWQGLGYYSRARNLHRAAQVVVEQHNGVIPDTEEGIRSLPGIGPYTMGAVLSIAFDKPVPAVDGNVLRVMARYMGLDQPIETTAVKRSITEKVQDWLYEARPSVLTQALMELGATICVPRSPKCLVCPLVEGCTAHALGLESTLPVKKPKQTKRSVDVYALWIEHENQVLMRKRPDKGLLAGMWELPAVECPLTEETVGEKPGTFMVDPQADHELTKLLETIGFGIRPQGNHAGLVKESGELPGSVNEAGELRSLVKESDGLRDFVKIAEEKHVFTHVNWRVVVIRPVGIQMRPISEGPIHREGQEYRFVARPELQKLVLPRVYEKLLEDITARVK